MIILAIESSCDETSAAVIKDSNILSNIVSSQLQHSDYGGVIPELASRLHQQQIVRVVRKALQTAEVEKEELNAVAFTRGPGLLGALLVGISFAKTFALALPLRPISSMETANARNSPSESQRKCPSLTNC